MKKALTIAGSDSGGGAGIQADLKTFTAFGVFGTSAITALTAQNTVGVQGICEVDPGFVKKQIQSVLDDIGTDQWVITWWKDTPIVQSMTGCERGLYWELLDHCWAFGSLPTNEAELMRLALCTAQEWEACWPKIKPCFSVGEDGDYHDARIDEARRKKGLGGRC